MARGTSFHENLCSSQSYERQIERLHSRSRGAPHQGVSFARLNFHRSRLAQMLAKAVARGAYVSGPARRKTIVVEGKERVIFSLRSTDTIVHGAVADILGEALAPTLSTRLYSYRKGRAWWNAVSDFARYLREQRARCADPKQRHMYVLRRDIDSYTDSIPVSEGSPVWDMLRGLVASHGAPGIPNADWKLIERVVRPEVEDGKRGLQLLERGVPTGQPISCVLFNLYLGGLDRELENVPGGFYARYSDDILFAHPSAEVARRVGRQIDAFLDQLGLRVKAAKSLDLYLTSAGRPSADWPEAKGTCTVPFMGVMVHADATVSLGRKKTRRFLRDVMCRASRIAHSLPGAGSDDLGRTVCESLNRMLEPDSNLSVETRCAALLRRVVTDRRQLAQLDHWIARIVVRAATGEARVRAFRKVSYRKVREEWGLISLEHTRNHWRGR